ncbi:MAG TPA: general secretion pathway protein GspB [Lysobacter sp.]
MSLILEALRKSEAERRRGQTPDLLTEPAPVKRPAHADWPRWWPWAAIVVALLLIAWFARGVFTSTPEVPGEPRSPTVVETGPVATTPRNAEVPSTAPATSSPVPAANPAATSTSPAPAPVATAPTATAAPEPQDAAPEPVATQRPDIAATAAPIPVSPPVAAPESLPAPAIPQTAPPPAFTSPDATLRLSDLSSEERQQLPPLKISMHMWAPEPAQRFVIIDGNRVTEGDRVGSAVVEAITSNGVTLAWQGRRIQLPIR